MNWKQILAGFSIALMTTSNYAQNSTGTEELAWNKLPDIPDAVGAAGMFAGASNDALLAGGGANFPNGMPWDGGVKVWKDDLYVLPAGASEWKTGFKLPAPRAYGVSVTAPGGVVCVGGSDSERHYSDAYTLTWTGKDVATKQLPSLPVPLANAGGGIIGDIVYVVAGTEDPAAPSASAAMYALDLTKLNDGWKILPPIPGKGRILPVTAVLNKELFVFSGAALHPGPEGKPERTYLTDAWKYSPADGKWTQLADMPRPAVAAPAIVPNTPGNSSLFIIGGDDGSLVDFQPPQDHPGFPANVLSYNAVVNRWAPRGTAPFSVATTVVAPWNGGQVIVSGEARPGVRTPEVYQVTMAPQHASFGLLNYLTLGFYLAVILFIGVGFSSSNATTDDYFRGGQKIPWWAAGLSIFATTLSSITFMAVPAKAFSENWVFALANLPILLIAPVIVYYIMPVFRRLDITSAYEYLERRFNLTIRLFGSAAFVLFQIGRMSIVMFLPALALATVTDFDIYTCIALMGILTIIYCVFGGISAVIWTDVVQTVVFLGGAVLAILYILGKTDGGLGGFMDIAHANQKLKLFNWTWNYTVASVWVIIVGNIFANLITYSSDQSTVQRYMTTESEGKAARSIWLNALVAVPATVLFFAVGTALYVYYAQHPSRLVPGIQNDAIFPLFIARELPAGVGGLLVASIFAAAQSTISTSMNCMSTVIVTDWYVRLRKNAPSEKQKLNLARWLTGILGTIGTCGALWMAVADIRSVWDVFLSLLGLAGGVMAGLFLLGIFTRRANATGATVGAIAGVIVTLIVWKGAYVHFFLYGMVGICSCVIVGYIASYFAPRYDNNNLRGLTIYGVRESGTIPEQS